MIDRNHRLSVSKQAHLLGISRGTVYYLAKPESKETLKIMLRMDELHLEFPFAGSRMLRDLLNREGIKISMDGKGCWRDNVFVERVWRSIKYEEVYLHAYASVREAKIGIARYIDFYNTRRPPSKLDKQTPDEFYYQSLLRNQMAA